VEKLELIKKGDRWFVETNDGFDGTAHGYGYKTPQAVYRAYAYFKNKDKREEQDKEVRDLLKNNPDIKEALDNYLNEDNCFYRLKDGEETSMSGLIEEVIDDEKPDVAKKLEEIKRLWKAILRVCI